MTTNIDMKQLAELAAAIRNQKESPYRVPSIAEALDKYALNIQIAKAEQEISNKRTLAIAEHKVKVASLDGYIKAVASTHPLQTELEIMITTYQPNKNKEGVKKAEAQNILRTAMNSPLKINYETLSHTGAKAIGSITSVEERVDRIIGRAVIWNDLYPDEAELVQSARELGTSWEIYYDPDKTVVEHGVSWLGGCVFAGLCVVSTPAYGTEARLKVRA
jgi:hypothetical protein